MECKQVRDATFKIFEQLDNPLTRKKGRKWIVRTRDGTSAILRTTTVGNLIANPKTLGNDAEIIGFDYADVTHLLAAVADGQTVTAYMVPIEVAEAAYRRNNREWLAADSERNQNKTWVLLFPGDPSKHDHFGHGMATVWAEYAVGSIVLDAVPPEPEGLRWSHVVGQSGR